MISDIQAPDSKIVRQAEELARSASSEMLFNHVMRSYWFAELVAQQEGSKADRELMFLSATLHDLGFTDLGRGQGRFEVEGAHAARRFLKEQGVDDDRSWKVWSTIALHTFDLNLYKEDEARLTELGILYDVIALPNVKLDPADVAEVLRRYPRRNFKRGFTDLLHKELETKQPYPHQFHICTLIEHQHYHPLALPDGHGLLNGAPFDE